MLNLFKRQPALGWIADEPDERDYGFEKVEDYHKYDDTGIIDKISLAGPYRVHPGLVTNQKNIPCCVAAAVSQALWIGGTINFFRPSVLSLYWNSRMQHTPKGESPTLTGTYIRHCMRQLKAIGVPSTNRWPFTTKKKIVNQQPPFYLYMSGYRYEDCNYAKIFEQGQARIDKIVQALNMGYPVVFGTTISSAFRDGGLLDVPDFSKDKKLGGHAMVTTGYVHNSDKFTFEILNSWGSNYGDGGFCYFTEDYVKWAGTRDLTVIYGLGE